jgi:hypothetical protein
MAQQLHSFWGFRDLWPKVFCDSVRNQERHKAWHSAASHRFKQHNTIPNSLRCWLLSLPKHNDGGEMAHKAC